MEVQLALHFQVPLLCGVLVHTLSVLRRWIGFSTSDRGIPFEVVSSPFPGRVCAALTELRERAEKARAATTEGRRAHWIAKVLESSKAVTDMRDEFGEKLRDGMPFRSGDDELDEKWIRWLHTYEALCDGLKDAEGVLA